MDAFWQANWEELYDFFAQGTPPLAIQLLVINTLFFMVWIVRRLRGAPALRRQTAITVEAILILTNMFMMFRQGLFV
jgi:hypothetical protein